MIKPTKDYIIIKPDDMTQKTESGIYIPETMESDVPQTGTVYGQTPPNSPLYVGVKVWVKMWAGDKIKYKGEELLIVHVKDIIAYEE